MPVDVRRCPRGAAPTDLDELHRFLTQVLTRIVGVANTSTIIPVKRSKQTTALKIA